MSMIAMQHDSRYLSTEEKRITVADVLQKLKEDLAAQLAVLADAKRSVQQLQVAIAAIERDETESKKRIEQQRPVRKRGLLMRGVIEALREGIGTVALIVRYLEEQGIKTTGASVSNVIQRLQTKKQVKWDLSRQLWALAAISTEDKANEVSAPESHPRPLNGGSRPLTEPLEPGEPKGW